MEKKKRAPAYGVLLAFLTLGALASSGCTGSEAANPVVTPAEPAVASDVATTAAAPSAPSDVQPAGGDIPNANPECRACREKRCTHYDGLFDLVAACFHHADPEFVRQCIEVRNCGYKNKCGYSATGAPECFCGSVDLEACQKPGAANGPCQKEWFAAARTSSLDELALHFSDVGLPAGVAHYLSACDRDFCPVCKP